ncbi:M4 family metallopeptidase [Mycolicibacterium nivoides]|uniref:M4 family metallopeptidase n=1 Tax=Mycolicibacterium nivoides TaxID=2487344 RepID=UPI000F5BE82D|nr:M4 family metallopeptidase [Mycolicibacterium nivoides]QRY44079.1 M4 family metallopeptidase [Mycolicibacterium boenickei]
MNDNGLESFALHSADKYQGPAVRAINDETVRPGTARAIDVATLDPESAARRYLNQMIANPEVPTITDSSAGPGTEYRALGTESVPLTDSTVVKFAQYRQHIPIYGSLVTIELDDANNMLAVNSAIGNPDGVDAVAAISPAQAQDVIVKDAGKDALPLPEPPRLYFYFDNSSQPGVWRLVYIAKNVQRHRKRTSDGHPETLPELFDYVVDAHSGDLVTKLPRTQTISWTLEELDSTDALGQTRRIRAERDENDNTRLVDPTRRIETYDFGFRRIESQFRSLPGAAPITNPPAPWSPAAISAHANAQEVADYLLNTLQRNGLDNQGGPFISSINCTSIQDPTPNEWRNAAWIGTQMVYGQRSVNGELRSYAVAVDVVAHEMTHGLTDNTARLEYKNESGALNESYSDIMGTIIANSQKPDIDSWNWEMGEELDGTGVPLRDLSDPTRRGQPAHVRDYVNTTRDNGGVHTNSGIHNKAAYNVISAKNGQGYLFTPQDVATLFYLALTLHLSRTSGFSDSRRAVELVAKSLFRKDPQDVLDEKVRAVSAGFEATGIGA